MSCQNVIGNSVPAGTTDDVDAVILTAKSARAIDLEAIEDHVIGLNLHAALNDRLGAPGSRRCSGRYAHIGAVQSQCLVDGDFPTYVPAATRMVSPATA